MDRSTTIRRPDRAVTVDDWPGAGTALALFAVAADPVELEKLSDSASAPATPFKPDSPQEPARTRLTITRRAVHLARHNMEIAF